MKLEIKPVFEWRKNRLYIGHIHFGTVGQHWNRVTSKEIFDAPHNLTFHANEKESKKWLEDSATIYISNILHGAQYEVSE